MMTIEEMKNRFSSENEKYLAHITDALSSQFGKEFKLSANSIEPAETLREVKALTEPTVALKVITKAGLYCRHIFLLEPKFVLQIFAWLVEADLDKSITDEHLDGLKELVNQILGQLQTTLSADSVALSFEIENPVHLEKVKEDLFADFPDQVIKAAYTVTAEKTEYTVFQYIIGESDQQSGSENESDGQTDDIFAADFQDFNTPSINADEPRNINMLMDVQMEIYVELGRKSMFIKDILKLSKGSIVELEKAAGEPLGVFVNGRKFAEGEVVVVDDQFGIRITQLIGPRERIQSLA